MSQHFVRLGRRQDFQRNLDACKALKLRIKESSETVEVHDGQTKVMWALKKSGDAWIVGYHREYFNEAA